MKIVFQILAILTLVALFAYLQNAYHGADAKTAVSLVEEAKVRGRKLGEQLENILPLSRRLCQVYTQNQFHGHMEVACRDVSAEHRVLRWRVSVLDGMVVPANSAAERLGKGEAPW